MKYHHNGKFVKINLDFSKPKQAKKTSKNNLTPVQSKLLNYHVNEVSNKPTSTKKKLTRNLLIGAGIFSLKLLINHLKKHQVK